MKNSCLNEKRQKSAEKDEFRGEKRQIPQVKKIPRMKIRVNPEIRGFSRGPRKTVGPNHETSVNEEIRKFI